MHKEQMQVAKFFIIISLLVSSSLVSYGQLQGSYLSLDHFRSYSFDKDGSFKHKIILSPNETLLGKGHFQLINNKELILEYKAFSDSITSSYLVRSKKELAVEKSSLFNIKVIDGNDSTPFFSAPVIHLLDSKKNELMSLFTDSNGKVQFFRNNKSENSIKTLLVRFTEFHSLEIELNEFIGYQVELEVLMHPKKYSHIAEGTIKHKIEIASDTLRIFSDDGTHQNFIRVK